MNFNSEGLKESLRYIKLSADNLRKAEEELSSLSLPLEFYSDNLSKVKSDIPQIINDINVSITNINTKLINVLQMEAENEVLAGSLLDFFSNAFNMEKTDKEKRNIDIKDIINKGINKINQLPDELYKLFYSEKENGELNSKKTTSIKSMKDMRIIDRFNIFLARTAGIDEFFKYFQSITGQYGINQDIFNEYIKLDGNNSDEYKRLLQMLETKYKMSTKDANILMAYMNSIGACSYSRAADYIVADYALKPDEFYDEFGFPLYIENSDGNLILNGGELLLDLYIKMNSSAAMGGPHTNMQMDESGSLSFVPNAIDEENKRFNFQNYLSTDLETNMSSSNFEYLLGVEEADIVCQFNYVEEILDDVKGLNVRDYNKKQVKEFKNKIEEELSDNNFLIAYMGVNGDEDSKIRIRTENGELQEQERSSCILDYRM